MAHTAQSAPALTHNAVVRNLQLAVTDMDNLSQIGFLEIGAIAKLTLLAMESEAVYRQPEVIARALRTIWVKAEDMERGISDKAGSVGFDHRDEAAERRTYAFRSAELHTHRALRSALAVVSNCNADGTFNEQEQAIRAALALAQAEGDAA